VHWRSCLNDSRVRTTIDLNGMELATDRSTVETGGTCFTRRPETRGQIDPSALDERRRSIPPRPQGEVGPGRHKDEKTRHILKRSPAAEAAKRSVQEKASWSSPFPGWIGTEYWRKSAGGKDSREMKGYLKKWTNYTSGWKLRWFVLEEGVLSYYKHQGITPRSIASEY